MLTKIIVKIQTFLADQEGATAIEYGLIAGGISLAIVAAVFAFGEDLGNIFNEIGNEIDTAAGNITG